jgi:hypothetical protein
MARRRSRLPRNLLLLGLAAAAGWSAWRFAPQWLGAERAPRPQVQACRLAPERLLAERIGRVAVESQVLAPAPGIPAASACAWVFFGGRAEARLFTPQSLRAGGIALDIPAYFASIATGLEYEFKTTPEPLAGLGDAALVAGADGGGPPQVVLRQGDRVLAVAFEGIDPGSAVAFARTLAEGL